MAYGELIPAFLLAPFRRLRRTKLGAEFEDFVIVVANLLFSPLYLLSLLMPRRPNRIAFGNSNGSYAGNPKYVFAYVAANVSDLEVAWISPNGAVVESLRAAGYRAHRKMTPSGLWYCLTAGIYVFGGRPSDVNFWTSGGARHVNLWHGVGLKGLGFHSSTAENRRIFNPTSLYRRLVKPWLHRKPDRFLSTAPLMTDHFCKAFRIEPSRCWEFGYPRSDSAFLPLETLRARILADDPGAKAILERFARYRRVVLYMPTYRDSHRDVLVDAGFDFARLDRAMAERDTLFVVKLHPWSRSELPPADTYANLWFAHATDDLYPAMPFTDMLVTDYSSVYFDYLLLDKPVALFVFDIDQYLKEDRDLVLDFDTYSPGPRARSFDELIALLTVDDLPVSPEQAAMRHTFWGDYAGRATEDVARELRVLARDRRLFPRSRNASP